MPERTIDIRSRDELAVTLEPMRAQALRGALILIGGADFAEGPELVALRSFFTALAAHCDRTKTAVVDGGTNSGVMRLIADARAAIGSDFALVGIAPIGAFDRRTRTGAPIERARGHSVIVTVPGERFGDESAWLFAAADSLHGGLAPAIVVNGGRLARREADARLASGAAVFAVEGSRRAADELAAALASDPGLRASGRLRTIPIGVDEAGLAAALEGVGT